jgi:ribosomal protein S27AE
LTHGNTARFGLVPVSQLNKSTVSGKDLYNFCLRGGVFVKRRKCKHCGRSFVVTAKHPDQKYCSQNECKRARKNDWQRCKLAGDEDYRINQANSQANWVEQHPGYWKKYREKHPQYAQRNREKQRERNINRRQHPGKPMAASIAKMDAKQCRKPFISGFYELIPVTDTPFAKMAPILVRIHEAAHHPGNPV